MMQDERLLVVSAHAADYVWRAGGTIAKYVKNGAKVHLVVLSVGVRGESNDLWKTPDQTAEHVKEIRTAETRKAAGILGFGTLNSGIWRIIRCGFQKSRRRTWSEGFVKYGLQPLSPMTGGMS